jgi:hypothetical protein
MPHRRREAQEQELTGVEWRSVSGSRTVFELELNVLGIHTCLETSGKFPKIHIYLPFLEYEFRLT